MHNLKLSVQSTVNNVLAATTDVGPVSILASGATTPSHTIGGRTLWGACCSKRGSCLCTLVQMSCVTAPASSSTISTFPVTCKEIQPLFLPLVTHKSLQIVALQFNPDTARLNVALKTGEVLSYDPRLSVVEVVGLLPLPIVCVQWCPGSAVAAVVLEDCSVVVIDETDARILHKHSLPVPSEKLSFFGEISWKGDGSLFAVNHTDVTPGKRLVSIFDKSGKFLVSCKEKVDLVQSVSWRPSGSFISVGTVDNRVVQFEQNGAIRGSFTCTGQGDKKLSSVLWNSSSDVLAVIFTSGNNPIDVNVQFWIFSNFKWYLKQSSNIQGPCVYAEWDPEDPMLFRVYTGLELHEIQFCWDFAVATESSTSMTAVVDGNSLLLTPLAQSIVPPPMSCYSIALPAQVLRVSFSGDIMAVHCSTTLFQPSSESPPQSLFLYALQPHCAPTLTCAVQHPTLSCVRLTQVLSSSRVLAVSKSPSSSTCDCIIDFRLAESNSITMIERTLNGRVLDIALGESSFFLELTNGAVFKSSREGEFVATPDHSLDFPVPCRSISVTKLPDGKEVVVGLSTRNHLFVGKILVSNSCTSFSLHPRFIVYTTLDYKLRLLPLGLDLTAELATELDNIWHDSSRTVERGAVIVAVPRTPDMTLVVMQMPRGNLESVHPRGLVTDTLRSCLERKCYQQGMGLIRRHRIDPNFLCDNNFATFMADLDLVIEQIQSPEQLNIFLSSLREENVAVKLYQNPLQLSQTPPPSTLSKVNTVCDKFIEILQTKDISKYYTSIFTAHAVKSPPDYESGLRLIHQLNRLDKSKILGSKLVEFAVVLVEVNVLFDTALGMYDFDLVHMVSEKSQRDPKEYIPFLEELQAMPEYYMKYSIDVHLRRYASALANLSKAGSDKFPECLRLIQEHQLYKQAMQLYEHNTPQFYAICELHGDYLVSTGSQRNAAILYQMASKHEKAITEFVSSNDWQSAFISAHKANYSPERLCDLAYRCVEQLESGMQFLEAADVLKQYCPKDCEKVYSLYLAAHSWKTAMQYCLMQNLAEKVEALIGAAIESAHDILLEMKSAITQHTKTCNRIVSISISPTAPPQAPDSGRQSKRKRRQKGLGDRGAGEPQKLSATLSGLSTNTGLRDDVHSLVEFLVSVNQMKEALDLQLALKEYSQMVIRVEKLLATMQQQPDTQTQPQPSKNTATLWESTPDDWLF
ncbi:IkappaB kinase complex, IKAP component [Pelomyxa schiedti]|nr:IkappaB kinase complex, IKAP component [Pelomyxa schiedti]